VLGHKHGGRSFPETVRDGKSVHMISILTLYIMVTQAHGVFGNVILIFIITQLVLGVYLRLHIHEKTVRPYVVPFHGIIGKVWPVLGWTQVRIF
jgi:hypothetical protein